MAASFPAHRRRPSSPSSPPWRISPPTPLVWASLLTLFALLSVVFFSTVDLDGFLRPPHSHSVAASHVTVIRTERAVRFPARAIAQDGGRSISSDGLWRSKLASFHYGCSNSSSKFPTSEVNTQPNRYLLIAASGGLNQQRTGITDAVVAARILNAVLVIPKLDQKSYWKDPSDFGEIFDVDWFINSLSKDVTIIKELPEKYRNPVGSQYSMSIPRKCSAKCYQTRVLPVLLRKHAVQIRKFDFRLANKLDTDLQKLRCRTNYHSLRFTKPIAEMGQKLVERMRMHSGRFVALHLRFEPDMLAFSGCYFGGGENERRELGVIQKRWKNLHKSNPEKQQRQGKCPLTPEEVGLMLKALGFGSDTALYVASGEVYGGEESLAPLRKLFPNIYSKDTLATKDELAPFSGFSSRMAALDYIVCDESDVFVTNNNGNMAKMLAGRRRYFGHKRTIRPNSKKLYSLFLNRTTMSWEDFAAKVQKSQKGFMGDPKEMKPGRGDFHENPAICICDHPAEEIDVKHNFIGRKPSRKFGKEEKDNTFTEPFDDDFTEDVEPEMPDVDDGLLDSSTARNLSNGTGSDYGWMIQSEEPELDDMLSD